MEPFASSVEHGRNAGPREGLGDLLCVAVLGSSSDSPCSRHHRSVAVEPIEYQPVDSVTALATEALELLRSRPYFADRVDWALVEHRVFQSLLEGADLGEALRPVWQALGDGHSHLVSARTALQLERDAELPVGHRLPHGRRYLRLPQFAGWYRGQAAMDYVQAAWAWFSDSPPSPGWVLDLRGNRGGSIVPMLAAVGPLLGAGQWLSYRRRDDSSQTYRYGTGEVSIGTCQLLTVPNPPRDTPALPVAILIDRRTASAAEAVLVAFQGRGNTRSFGTQTAGVPTGNSCHQLADGSLLAITQSVAVDRIGRTYASAIAPDIEGGLAAAYAWLVHQLPTARPPLEAEL